MKTNKNTKKSIAISALATGTVVLGSMAGAVEAQAADLFSFETLGSGAELRSELLSVNDATAFVKNNELELKCGEGKCGEGKCGEGDKKKAAKAGADAKDGKAKMAADAKDGKAAEHKCGEGKCGEGKCGEKKEAKKETKSSDDK